ncbi:MAG TPA: MBL fold metallo-hydrolase [Kofleriaceae bacterium]|jgi:glyoxylase-like metal-dependent hydrolase (beta-lactamase superfamily II)|nr:MBL fold metallo-hydrolase [Kofleriaceae bacterium]
MAREADAIAANVRGDFFVDSSCIDCDLCRQLAPEVFARDDRAAQSFVAAQPAPAGGHRALMALVTCPTSSIGTRGKHDVRAAARAFPEPLFGDVAFCGYASEASYGAASYLIRRPDGNVLVDSPRFAEILVERIAALGGVRTMVLTHQDDVADHAKFRARFGCERVIHRADVRGDTRACERIIEGDTELAPDLRLIHVPGHTRGSIALLHGDALFTGDHLWATDDQIGLEAGREVCWYSWSEQRASIARLAAYSFTHVLPGHGRRFTAPDAEAMRAAVLRAAA